MMQLQKAITRILVGEGRDVATALHAIGVSVQQLETLSARFRWQIDYVISPKSYLSFVKNNLDGLGNS